MVRSVLAGIGSVGVNSRDERDVVVYIQDCVCDVCVDLVAVVLLWSSPD